VPSAIIFSWFFAGKMGSKVQSAAVWTSPETLSFLYFCANSLCQMLSGGVRVYAYTHPSDPQQIQWPLRCASDPPIRHDTFFNNHTLCHSFGASYFPSLEVSGFKHTHPSDPQPIPRPHRCASHYAFLEVSGFKHTHTFQILCTFVSLSRANRQTNLHQILQGPPHRLGEGS